MMISSQFFDRKIGIFNRGPENELLFSHASNINILKFNRRIYPADFVWSNWFHRSRNMIQSEVKLKKYDAQLIF